MTNVLEQKIGLRIKAFREQKSLTQRQLAFLCGKSIETISNFERGSVVTSLPTLERLAQIFEVSIRDFFDETMVPDTVPISKNGAAILNSVKILPEDDQELLAGLIAVLEDRVMRKTQSRPATVVHADNETPAVKSKRQRSKPD
jgi:transcriptional regulator with XRE-family HTH domain